MNSSDRQTVEEAEQDATAEMARYCEKHPRSPSAVRQPRLMFRGRTWVAILGYTLQDGIAGIGATVDSALSAFDAQYLASFKPPRG